MPTITDDIKLDVDVSEEPGTGFPVAECPYCSRGYAKYNVEYEEVEIPTTCRRCGGPMDYDECHKEGGFADQQAAIKVGSRRMRDRAVKAPAKAKD